MSPLNESMQSVIPTKKRIAILQSNYIPWRGYFDLISKVDSFVIYDEVQYSKNDWRNRNIIKTAKGPAWITIPVRQASLQQKINETRITQSNWNIKHWNTIHGNYARAPFYKEHADYFNKVYMSIKTDLLSEVNLILLSAINQFLNITTKIIDSVALDLQGDRNERLVDAVLKLGGNHYLSGPAARDYLDEGLFEKNNIAVEWMDYSNYLEYPQLFPPFDPRVTILDFIFNTGSHKLY